jgi:hypothetical protein
MVDVMGHVAMGLLWALPAWFVWDGRVSLAFVALTAVMAPVPDVDRQLAALFPGLVHHHGVTHTVVFVLAIGVVAGALASALLTDWLDGWIDTERFDRRRTFLFATGAFVVGGLSHVFADMLSAPDIADSIEPLWPLYHGSIGVDLVWYNDPVVNWGLLAAGVLVNVGLFLYLGRRPSAD